MSKLLFIIFITLVNNLCANNTNFKYPCKYEVKYELEDERRNRCIIMVIYTFNNRDNIENFNIINKENCSNFDNINITPGNIVKIKWTTTNNGVGSVANLMISLNEEKAAFADRAVPRNEQIEENKITTTICKAKISQKSASNLTIGPSILTEKIRDSGYKLRIIE